MSIEELFMICNYSVLPIWALLMFAPKWKWTLRIARLIFPFSLAIVYSYLLFSTWGEGEGNFFTLEGVYLIFQDKESVLIGWIHYLVFDLLVGTYEVVDAQKRGIRHIYIIPCLFFTLMFGPFGFLLYCLLRWTLTKEVFGQEMG